jgi:hypothetical protein
VKLSAAMVERALDHFKAHVLSESHPAIGTLSKVFGEHTFFIDDNGLSIVQPAIRYDSGAKLGQVVKLASRTDKRYGAAGGQRSKNETIECRAPLPTGPL